MTFKSWWCKEGANAALLMTPNEERAYIWEQAQKAAREAMSTEPIPLYVITYDSYSDYSTRAIFTDKAAAQAWIMADGGADYEIEEWMANEEVGWHRRTVYCAAIDADTGEVFQGWTFEKMASPHARSEPHTGAMILCDRTEIRCFSLISSDHAVKLAIEARQAYLREKVPTE